MAKPTVVVGKETKEAKWPPGPDAVRSGLGSVTGWVGLAFLLVGGLDFALSWIPLNFGDREWEFGAVSASLNGLPVPVIGLVLLLTGALLLERRWWSVLVAGVSAGLCLWVLVGGVLYLTTIPLALQTVPVEVATGLKRAILKAALQNVTYPIILAFLAWRAIGAARGTIGK